MEIVCMEKYQSFGNERCEFQYESVWQRTLENERGDDISPGNKAETHSKDMVDHLIFWGND